MTTIPLPRRERQLAAFGMTVLVHALLVLGWQAVRQPPPREADVSWLTLKWIVPSAQVPAGPATAPATPARKPAPPARPAARRDAQTAPAAQAVVPAPAASAEPAAAQPADDTAPVPSAQAMLEGALRDAGAVDRALRKEARPLIVAPYDSPQIRLRKGIEAAAEMAPNKWYEAPKIAELVNNTGNGERRTRVITGRGTYCVTESATNARIDMIEKHGKIRKTTCSKNEARAGAQEWRTARDP